MIYSDVQDFHDKFNIPTPARLTLLDAETLEFRRKFLQEELNELIKAHEEKNIADAVDSMIDLIYVAIGTLDMMGLTETQFYQAWKEVQRANMSKERARSASQSKRGSALDVIKPAGWQGPDYSFLETA